MPLAKRADPESSARGGSEGDPDRDFVSLSSKESRRADFLPCSGTAARGDGFEAAGDGPVIDEAGVETVAEELVWLEDVDAVEF